MVPDSLEPNVPGWPELLAATGGVTGDAVGDYLRRLRRYDLLTAGQEVELAQEIEAGLFAEQLLADGAPRAGRDSGELRTLVLMGKRAADALLHANLRLVVSIAKHYTRRGFDFEDLIQEGNLGLHRAVRTFDFTKGFRFSIHATWQIRSGITQALANQSRLIRPPTNVIDQLWDSYHPDATDALFQQQMNAQLHAVLGTLEDREALVIAMRFGLTGGAMTLDAVANAFGTTRERIRQIEIGAMEKLKDPDRSSLLRPYHCDGEGPPGREAASPESAPAPDA